MKSIIVILALFMSITAFACPMDDAEVAKKSTNTSTSSVTVKNGNSPVFLSPYFVMHAKLIKDVKPSNKDIKALQASLSKEIKNNKSKEVKKELKKAQKFVKAMEGKEIKALRAEFYSLSKVLIPFSKKHKLKGVQAYYCPMAKKTWLQNQSNITYNPYMPKKMLHCGSKI